MPPRGYAVACRRATSSAIVSSSMPPSLETVPVKYLSTTVCESPTASKIWAPVYEATVETPIFDITLSTPLPSALTRLATAFSGSALT